MLTVSSLVMAPLSIVWKVWNDPTDIIVWCTGHPDWHTPRAENDLKVGGKFLTRMEARDGSQGFDFNGVYSVVEPMSRIEYVIEDGRKVIITFVEKDGGVLVTEDFDAENIHSHELQIAGWQGILDNFKVLAESRK